MKKPFLEAPSTTLTRFADVRKGGGFEYVGAIMPIEKFPAAYREGLRVAEECGTSYSTGARVVGQGHCMMFFWAYAFNRADEGQLNHTFFLRHETEITFPITTPSNKTNASVFKFETMLSI